MTAQKFLEKLQEEMPSWLKKKWIQKEESKKILNYYAKEAADSPKALLKVSSLGSVFFIILGSLAIILTQGQEVSSGMQILFMILALGFIGFNSYLFANRQKLIKGFVQLWITSGIMALLLILVNNFLGIKIPVYLIFVLWFLCIIPFVWKYKFKYFYIMSIVLLHIATLLFAYYFYSQSFWFVGIILCVGIGAVIMNVAKISRVSQKYSVFKENLKYYDLRYSIGTFEITIAYLLLCLPFFFNTVDTSIQNYYELYTGDLKYLAFLALIPLLTSLSVIALYRGRRKKWFQEKYPKNERFAWEHIKALVYDEAGHIVHNLVFFLGVLLIFTSGLTNGKIIYVVINIVALFWIIFMAYEGVIVKIKEIVNLAIWSFLIFVGMKYISLFYDLMHPGVFFVIGGIVLFGLATLIEKNREKYICSLGQQITINKVDYDF